MVVCRIALLVAIVMVIEMGFGKAVNSYRDIGLGIGAPGRLKRWVSGGQSETIAPPNMETTTDDGGIDFEIPEADPYDTTDAEPTDDGESTTKEPPFEGVTQPNMETTTDDGGIDFEITEADPYATTDAEPMDDGESTTKEPPFVGVPQPDL